MKTYKNFLPVQLPNDVVAVGYIKVGRFEIAQVFKSNSCDFEGTEAEFCKAGLAYRFEQIDKYTRRIYHHRP